MSTPRSLFHFAFNVTDLDAARRFYGGVLGCTEGRSTDTWVDFDFFGHQISLHLGQPFPTANTGHVGDKLVPMPHFGLILQQADWQAMADRLSAAGTRFVLSVPMAGLDKVKSAWFFPTGDAVITHVTPQKVTIAGDALRIEFGERRQLSMKK